ncbi:hypothetical protein TWF788_001683 [Orbilia oligospora]|uniref:Uncharacterized protein n=1 Tax=Orbilia oligospora TaxID=2813651 RepID=A0A7C8P0V5_ORBOL|nr:hypothetical protein TWF788_001683 [Orbilia oligospora]
MSLFGSIYRYFQVNIILDLSINSTVSETWSAHEDCRHKLPDELGKTHNQGYVRRA